MTFVVLSSLVVALATTSVVAGNCRFANDFTCDDFKSTSKMYEYMGHVMKYEGQFAQPGIAYDAATGYTYDGHPLAYATGELFGEPHLFSAPSKESIHVSILALAIEGNKFALEFAGGFEKAIEVLELKMKGYSQFNATYPGFGCFTPWVGFNTTRGTFDPIDSWTVPYNKVPGLDNGEWFWALYAVSVALNKLGSKYSTLAQQYADFVQCQKDNVKTIFYRGNGDVSATVYILDPSIVPNGNTSNYIHADGYLNDPYEGETMCQMMYLYSPFDTEEEREMLWTKKQGLFESVNYEVPAAAKLVAGIQSDNKYITVQKGYWFSTHEQWKTLLMPYLAKELPLVRKVFANAEKARTWDAYANKLPGMLASINDVTDGSQDIPDYASACGIAEISYEKIERRDIMTPYGAYGLFLHNQTAGFCWYNNMLKGPRMQSKYGSTEAINANGTEISPLTTWDSKITTVLAMLGGVGDIVERGMRLETDPLYKTAFDRFVYVVNREHERVFGSVDKVLGDEYDYMMPSASIPSSELTDWSC